MSRAFVVARVVLDSYGHADGVGELAEWEGTNGPRPCRVPVGVYPARATAEAEAGRLTRAAWREFGPARFATHPDAAAGERMRAVLRRHGFDPPVFSHYEPGRGWAGEDFAGWWAGQGDRLTPAVAAEVAEAAGPGAGLYEVRELPLED